MAGEKSKSKSGSNNTGNDSKKRKRFLPYNKAVKKGGYPLKPGVQGFFITCDGGRERQASQEAIQVIESFFEELVQGKDSDVKQSGLPNKPMNKKITFAYSDSEEEEDDDDDDQKGDEDKDDLVPSSNGSADIKGPSHLKDVEGTCPENKLKEISKDGEKYDESPANLEVKDESLERQPAKKQCVEADLVKDGKDNNKVEEQSIDKLIDAELEELKDKSKVREKLLRRFNSLDSGCNGVVFIQMRKRDGDPSPKDIAQHMITSIAATKKHISRFILRVLPVEVTCYASEEEITRAIKPLIEKYFPAETPHKYAVICEARANTGVERMKIINAVAKCVPEPHKVDLNNPERNIVVQIAKAVCSIGVIEKYKELAKYNLRQLTTSK